MTKLVVVSVKDSAIDAFLRPFCVQAIGQAVRSFTDEVNRSAADNSMWQHPEDYSLWYLGTFDEETGLFEDQSSVRMLARGQDIKTA